MMKRFGYCTLPIYLLVLTLLFVPAAAEQLSGARESGNAPNISTDVGYILSMEDEQYEWVCFTADEGEAYYRADYKNEEVGTSLYMELYDKNGIQLNKTDTIKGKSSYISFKAESGEQYYLRFSRYSSKFNGRFTLQLSRHPDAYANSIEDAAEIRMGESIISSFDGTDDEDFLRLTAGAESEFCRVDIKNENINTSVYVELLDRNGFSLLKKDVSQGHSGYISFKTEPLQTYYLRLYRYNGKQGGVYSVKISSTQDTEPDVMEQAKLQTVDTQVLGTFDGTGDVDWFRLKTLPDNAYYQVNFKNESVNTSVYAEIFDQNGLSIVKEGANKGYSSWVNWLADPGAEYYIRFSRYSQYENGGYSFTIREFPDAISNELPRSAALADGAKSEYTLGSKKDADWFAVEAGDIPVFTELTLHSADTSVRLTLTNESEQQIDTLYVGKGKTEILTFALEANTCVYAKVTGDGVGAYTLSRKDMQDEGGNSMENAFAAEAGGQAALALEMQNDVDYVAFPGAGSTILISNTESSSIRVSMVDKSGKLLVEERTLYGGKDFRFTADSEGAYLCVRGKGGFSISCCTPEAHIPFGQWIQIQYAACGQEGIRQMLCLACGEPAKEEADPALEHQAAGDWKKIRSARCDDEGIEAMMCALCGKQMETRTIPATGHLQTGWFVLVEASCEEDGLQQRTCNDCGKVMEQEQIPAHGHIAGQWINFYPEKCTKDGLDVRLCRICEQTVEERPIPAPGHVPGEWVTRAAAGCTEDGRRLRLCDRCGGIVEGEDLPALGHDYGEWIVTKEPTMTEAGEQIRTCGRCGDSQTQAIEKRTLLEGIFGK